jgi:hypothetical protein
MSFGGSRVIVRDLDDIINDACKPREVGAWVE